MPNDPVSEADQQGFSVVGGDGTAPTHQENHPSDAGPFMYVPARSEVLAAIHEMQQDLGHPWSIAELARVVHVSGSHLMRLFAEDLGVAPIAWLTRRRVQEMARLLRDTRLSVLEISRQVGWRDRGHASEQFKRFTGTTPTQYRVEQRRTAERHCLWCGQPVPSKEVATGVEDHRAQQDAHFNNHGQFQQPQT